MVKGDKPYRMIISGGGTGGHVYPAIAIANAFKYRYPDADILFVGALGRMEMTRVPEAGYRIIGLWISGLQRSLSLSNLSFPFKLISSYFKARRIVKEFNPHVAVGTGGYASGPLMIAATAHRVPSLLQEQNSYAGLTNKKLAPRVKRICVAYPGMEKFFPAEKVTLTGNPVRKDIMNLGEKRQRACAHFGLQPGRKTLLVLGGSGGARTINQTLLTGIDKITAAGIQVIWQCGKVYHETVSAGLSGKDTSLVRLFDFVKEMDFAYAAADLVISRAGALSISELCLAMKPVILVPSPNVAEDHQTRNAQSLVDAGAAELVRDAAAANELIPAVTRLMADEVKMATLAANIGKFARPNAAEDIVNEIEKLIA